MYGKEVTELDVYKLYLLIQAIAQSVRAEEYTDCFSAERKDSSKENSGYDIKQSDGEARVMLELWRNAEYPFTRSTPARSDSNW